MTDKIALIDIPKHLLDDMRERVWMFGASVFDVLGSEPAYRGTVTFVTVGSNQYLLTARHVWQSLAGNRLALALDSDRPLTVLPKEVLNPKTFELDATIHEEWGPDLALIQVPAEFARQIGQYKAFYNLDKRWPLIKQHPPAYASGAWAVLGAIAEQSQFANTEAQLKISLLVSVVRNVHERRGFDYVDLSYFHEGRPDLPKSYGGLSGSGLWCLPIAKSSSGTIEWSRDVILEGVAFYQKVSGTDEGVIRCHGRGSLYSRLMSGLVP